MKIIKTSSYQIDSISTGAVIKDARRAKKLSLKIISERTGLSIGYLSDLERGRRNWNSKLFKIVKGAIR